MKELVGDKFYTTLSEKYNELLLDYVLLSWDEDYHGAESHKKAVIEAILSILNTRHRVGNNIKHPLFYVHESDMQCIECDAGAFFYEDNRGRFNKGVSETPEKMKMNYWLAFSGPPYGILIPLQGSLLFPLSIRSINPVIVEILGKPVNADGPLADFFHLGILLIPDQFFRHINNQLLV